MTLDKASGDIRRPRHPLLSPEQRLCIQGLCLIDFPQIRRRGCKFRHGLHLELTDSMA